MNTKKKVPNTLEILTCMALPDPSHSPLAGLTGHTVGIQSSGIAVLGNCCLQAMLEEPSASVLKATPTNAPMNYIIMILMRKPVFSLFPSRIYTPSDTAGFI